MNLNPVGLQRRVLFFGRRRLHQWLPRPLTVDLSPAMLHGVALVSVCFVALLLRLVLLGEKSLWFDEAFSVYVARLPFRQIPQFAFVSDAHPPGFYLLLHFWIWLFGHSEVAVRLPGVIASVGTVIMTYLLARHLSTPRVGLLAATVVAIAPFQVMAAQEARMYPLLGFLGVASAYALWRALQTGQRRHWILYAGAMTAAIYLHYFGFLLFCFHGLYVVAFHWRDSRARLCFVLALAAVIVLYVPWWRQLIYHTVEGRAWPVWRPRSSPLELLLDTTVMLSFGGHLFNSVYYAGGELQPVKFVLPLVAPFLMLLALGVAVFPRDTYRGWFVLGYLCVPLVSVVIATIWFNLAYAKYFSFLGPPFAILLAAGMEALARANERVSSKAITAALLMLVATYATPVLYDFYVLPYFEPYNWRGAAQHISQHARADDVVVIYPSHSNPAFSYYYAGPQSKILVDAPDPKRPVDEYQPDPKRVSFTRDTVKRLWKERRRIWLVLTIPMPKGSTERLKAAIARYFVAKEMRVFGEAVWVELYEPKQEPTLGP